MEIKVTVSIHKESDWYVAVCEEYKITVKSITIEDALANLQCQLSEYLRDEYASTKANILFVIKMPV